MKIPRKKAIAVSAVQQESSSYTVGYAKPPVHTRFKPGKSGNPKGRTKGHQNFNTLLRNTLSQTIEVFKSGSKHKMPKYAVMITTLVNKALQGDMRAINVLLPYILKMEQAEKEIAQKVAALSQDDKAILAMYVNRNEK
ncbi:DUF5681 domain-containing protein [Candidatus Avelusimicrobium fimicolum]|uniref:DUF5681 domain-containing protein n=1 Tax=Candidatus Avelusimicrobium fimicolum TaxID=3416216 RepID=UPI003D144F3D